MNISTKAMTFEQSMALAAQLPALTYSQQMLISRACEALRWNKEPRIDQYTTNAHITVGMIKEVMKKLEVLFGNDFYTLLGVDRISHQTWLSHN